MIRAKRNRQTLPRSKTGKLADTKPVIESKAALPFWSFPILSVFLTCISFLAIWQNGFLSWDDEATLVNNLRYRGLGWRQIQWMFSTFYLGHYQPLSWVTFALDYLIWGLDPFGYHLTNLLFHSINAALFYYLSLHLLSLASPTSDRLAVRMGAFFSALLFAIHPLRVESVAWATERRDVLSGLLILLTVLSYLYTVVTENKRYGRWLSLTLAIYGLSLLAKASGMTLPLVLVLLDVYPLRRLGDRAGRWFGARQQKVWWEKIPFFLLAIACGVVALLAQREAGALRGVQRYDVPFRIAQAFFGVIFYLWKTVIPIGLSPLYEAPFYVNVTGPVFVLSLITVLGISASLWRLRSVWPAGLASWIYYLLLLGPVLGFAQSGPQLVADRYSYLSCLSWAVLAGAGLVYVWNAWLSGRIPKGSRDGACAAAAMVTVLLGALTWRQVQVWHDSERLWSRVLAVTPRSSFAQNNLGNIRSKRGELDDAAQRFRYALEINPRFAEAHYNLANVLYIQGNFAQAMNHYREAISIRPNYAEARYNLGVALGKLNRLSEAAEHYRVALRLRPDDEQAHNNLANILFARGEISDAMEHYREALRIKPGFAEARENLNQLLEHQRKTDEKR